MDQEFIRLMQISLGNPNPTVPSIDHNLNPDYAAEINAHVANLNAGLNLHGPNQFVGNLICPENPNGLVVGPVCFSSTFNGILPNEESNPFVLAVFGLNPKLGSHTCSEKRLAGNNLESYAAFYNSQSFNPNGVFPLVLNPIVRYYKYLLTVYVSFLYGKFFVWSRFVKRYPNPVDQLNWLKSKLLNCPIIVPEYIPFHSDKSSTIHLTSLYATGLNYPDYHEALFNMLKRRLNETGILLSNGKSSTDALVNIIGTDLISPIKYFTPRKVLSHTLAIWNGRLVVMLNDFLGRAGTGNRFITDDHIKYLLMDILVYCKSNGTELPKHPCSCNEPINQKDKYEGQLTDDDLFEDLFPDIEENTLEEQAIFYKQNSQPLKQTSMSKKSTGIMPPRNNPGETTESIEKFSKDNPQVYFKKSTVRFKIDVFPFEEEGEIRSFRKHIIAEGRCDVDDEVARIVSSNRSNRKNGVYYVFYEEII